MEENREIRECHCGEHKAEHWIKFALLLVALFLACYLAMYYVLDQIRHSYYIPSRMDNIDKILKEQDRMFNDMTAFPLKYNALVNVKSPIETYKDDDAYKILINLKPFNNNPENIKIDVSENKVNISGEEKENGKHSEKLYSFSQSFVLPEKIKTNKIKKEIENNTYIITLPIDD